MSYIILYKSVLLWGWRLTLVCQFPWNNVIVNVLYYLQNFAIIS